MSVIRTSSGRWRSWRRLAIRHSWEPDAGAWCADHEAVGESPEWDSRSHSFAGMSHLTPTDHGAGPPLQIGPGTECRACPKSTPQLGHALSVENALRSVAGTATKARPSAVARPMRIDTPHTLTRWRVTSRSWAASLLSADTLPAAQRRAAGTEPQKVCQSREQTEQQVKIVRAGTT